VTYCAAALVEDGIVLLADTRTNAGVDSISSFRKMSVFGKTGVSSVVVMTAGNLAITQAVIGLLKDADAEDSRVRPLHEAGSMAEAARMVGSAVRQVYERDAAALKEHGIEFSANFIVGGQVGDEVPRLFQVYAAGNYIEATVETPYFQIGESKYGKPIIDRMLRRSSTLVDALKCLLISMDSTLRSNLSVGMPLDVAVLRRNERRLALRTTLAQDDSYFQAVRESWNQALENAFNAVPAPPWLAECKN
jgi:putative proteasome-type protease